MIYVHLATFIANNMTLIKSISGIRGTIGGTVGNGLTPLDIVKYTAAFARLIVEQTGNKKIVVGRDARISGEMVSHLVLGTLQSMGIEVIHLGLSTTPTVELAVPMENAGGGIILTASHNPKQWNALKLLNQKGEFISDVEGQKVLQYADDPALTFEEVDDLGQIIEKKDYLEKHIQHILDLALVDVAAIRAAQLRVVVDPVNSSGGIFVPALLEALGVQHIEVIHGEPTGKFAHNPEPLAEHLIDLSEAVLKSQSDLGIAVDPDVDRLCFMMEDGQLFGEEYTLVAVADYVLSQTPGNTVSNLSSTRALRDVTHKYGQEYQAAAVGEVNVVRKMKEVQAVIGGEGNGGIIYPESHYGRDALVGIALFLSHLAKKQTSMTALRKTYPAYFMSKNKIELTPQIDVDHLLMQLQQQFKDTPHHTIDGLKIDFEEEWVHLRKSNTEPIIRIYAEAKSPERASQVAHEMIQHIQNFLA
jgi:phosphomannomutase